MSAGFPSADMAGTADALRGADMLRAIKASFIVLENKGTVLRQATGGAFNRPPLPTKSMKSLENVINHCASPAEELPASACRVPLRLIRIKGRVMY